MGQVYIGQVTIVMSAGISANAIMRSALIQLVTRLKVTPFGTVQLRPQVTVGGGITMKLNPRVIAGASVNIGPGTMI